MAQRQPIILKNEPLAVISVPTMNHIQEPLEVVVADFVRFAAGQITRTDLEAGVQAAILAIYEMQEDCRACKGTGQFLPQDPRNLWKCPACGGKRWHWKQEDQP